MKKKLFAMLLCLVMLLSSVSYLSEVSFAEGSIDLSQIHTIAKTLEGGVVKYYGIRYYDGYSQNSNHIFYEITKENYDKLSNEFFMIFKKEKPVNSTTDETFIIPNARRGKGEITDDSPDREYMNEKIFTEVRFRNHTAYYWLVYLGDDSISHIDTYKYLNWNVELTKDWVIEVDHRLQSDDRSDYAVVEYNCNLKGNNHKIYRADKNKTGIFTCGTGRDFDTTSPLSKVKVTLNDLIIDGDNKLPCFCISANGEINLNNVTIQNGYADKNHNNYGGGITVRRGFTHSSETEKKYTILNMDEKSKIINCEANYGGAIRLFDDTIANINGSTILNNEADLGGAICSFKDTSIININNALISNNKTVKSESPQRHSNTYLSGGAIYCDKNLTIKNSNFNNNSADKNGGAIFTYEPFTVEGSTFDGNIATKDGGAIWTSNYKYPNIDNATVFKNNVALAGFFNPPTNYNTFTNLKFARNSFTDAIPESDLAKSLLNNYDINYKYNLSNYTAYFNPNGGEFTDEGNPDPKAVKKITKASGTEINILEAPKRDGYKFLGWKGTRLISDDMLGIIPQNYRDSEKIYKPGEKYKLNYNTVFLAQWEAQPEPQPEPKPTPTPQEPNKYILTLDENYRGGEITDHELEEGELIEPYLYIPRRRGYIFRGWSYDRKHLEEVKPEDRIHSDTILYAIWKKAEIEKHEEPEEIRGDDHKAYIFGYPNGTVRPNGNITRAEAAAMLARLLNIEAIGSSAKPNFKDTESAWYNKAINAIVARGIMKGYPDGRFRPNAPITRAEFTQMIWAIDNKPYGEAPFIDVKGHWAERAIGSEYQAKRIAGYPDGLFRPDADITRAEAAVILNKIFERNFDNLSLAKCKNILMLKRFTDLDESFWGYNDMVEATNSHKFIRRYKDDVMKRLEEDWLLIKDINDIK